MTVSFARVFIALIFALWLAGCGGGGSGRGDDGGGNSGSGGSSGPRDSIQVAPASVRFAAERGASLPPSQQLSVAFVGDGVIVGYPPDAGPVSWLSVNAPSSAQSPVTVTLSVTSTGLPPGTYSTKLRFASGKADASNVVTQDVVVSYAITDPIKLNVTDLQFDAVAGQSMARAVAISGNILGWSAVVSQPWLTVSPASGSGPGRIQVTANAAMLSAGVHTANLAVTDAISNITRTVPVSFDVSANRWNVSRTGVSLLAFADNAASSASVLVTNDAREALTWTASASEDWMTVTPTGGNGDALIISANGNAAALAADTVHFATVTVNGGSLSTDSVRVGYYRSSQNEPDEMHYTVDTSTGNPRAELALDPVRPYVYLGLSTPDVTRVHLITGARDVLFSTPGARIAGLVVSGDGRTLYATTAALPGDVVRFDLDANTTLAPLPRQTLCCTQDLVWVRNRGVPALITNNLEVFNLTTNQASTIVGVPPQSGIDSSVIRYWYIAKSRDDAELWNFYETNALGCSSGQSYRITTRSTTGDAYLTAYRSPPSIAGGTCATLTQFATSHDAATWHVLSGHSYYFGPAGGPLSPLNPQREYSLLTTGYDDRVALIYYVHTGQAYAHHLLVLDPIGNVLRDSPRLDRPEAMTFVADGRFLLVEGGYLSATGSLHLFRLP
jgi:hypothetical protein